VSRGKRGTGDKGPGRNEERRMVIATGFTVESGAANWYRVRMKRKAGCDLL
jgi:hypothetical protein